VGLAELTSRDAVVAAMEEFDRLGRSRFLETYGFGRSRGYFVLHDGRRYDSKAIVGVAHHYEHPELGPLAPSDFSGGESTVARRLEQLGFVVERPVRNPDWTTDELLIALDVYRRHGLLDDTDSEVIELSRVLQALPIHPTEARSATFRNPNGIALKLANLASCDPGYTGKSTRGARRDQEVWQTWAGRWDELAEVASQLRHGASAGALIEIPEPDEDEVEAQEGRLLYRQHRRRERDERLREAKIRASLERGPLRCEACDFDFAATYGGRGEGYIECHHVRPLHEVGESTTRLADLALVCSNCHRMIHRRAPWPTPDELRSLIAQRLSASMGDTSRTSGGPPSSGSAIGSRPRELDDLDID
jgi:5-methylcytosine-specific restriction protein A